MGDWICKVEDSLKKADPIKAELDMVYIGMCKGLAEMIETNISAFSFNNSEELENALRSITAQLGRI